MQKEYIAVLKRIVNNYEEFKRIAVPLKWADTETAYCDASQYFREVYLRFYSVKFPRGYLQNNFADAFVQMMLTVINFTEEYESDFWTNMSLEERFSTLTKGESYFSEYICFERLGMQEMTAKELQNDVWSWFPWARTKEEMSKPYAYILPDDAKEMFSDFSQAEAVWLGGTKGCTPDENWIAVQDDAFLFVMFHVSG